MRMSLAAALVVPIALIQVPNASERDLRQLQDEVENLGDSLKNLEARSGDARVQEFERRAEEIRDDLTYLKVKMRRHEREGQKGTGLTTDEVADVRRSVARLRDDID